MLNKSVPIKQMCVIINTGQSVLNDDKATGRYKTYIQSIKPICQGHKCIGTVYVSLRNIFNDGCVCVCVCVGGWVGVRAYKYYVTGQMFYQLTTPV